MGPVRRFARWFYAQPAPDGQPASDDGSSRSDPPGRGRPLILTVMFGRRAMRVEIGPSASFDGRGGAPAPEDAVTEPDGGADGTAPAPPPGQAEIPFWDALDPTEREALRAVASWRTFAAGAMIMQEGERADHVIVILGGRTRICVSENGRERSLGERGVGQLVGERGALEVSVRSATVIALDLVWALAVETKDFAAFITAHPRVLALVQRQQYDRGLGGSAEYGDDHGGPAGSQPGPPGRVPADKRNGFTLGREPSLTGQNCTVALTDVVEFGARHRTDRDRLIIRRALFTMTQAATRGIPGVRLEDRGDGILAVAPPEISTADVVNGLIREFQNALDQHNHEVRESARFQLRLAVNVGPVVADDLGVSGEAIIVAARLVDAPGFKQALAESTAALGVIASPFVYETVIRHGQDPDYVAAYSPIPVEVKESHTSAWMTLNGASSASPFASRTRGSVAE